MANENSAMEAQTVSERFMAKEGAANTREQADQLLTRMATGLERWIHPLTKHLAAIGSFLVLIMALVITVDVVMRTLGGVPLAWAIEMEQFMLAMVVFLSVAYTLTKNGHVNIDLFSTKFSPNTKSIVESMMILLGIFFFSVIAVENFLKLMESYHLDEMAEISKFPIWPFLGIIVLGSILTILVLVINLLKSIAAVFTHIAKPWFWLGFIVVISTALMVMPYLLNALSIEVGNFEAGLLGIIFLMVLMFLGPPIGFAMGFVGIIGNWYISGFETSLGIVKLVTYDTVADYFFCVAPLFILMGFLCYASGLSGKLYDAGYKWFGSFRGGLSISTIFGCAGFSAICGGSLETAATIGSVALPEMKKYKYSDSLATGCLAAGGTLGILIPPSMGFIIYGILTEQSIAALFMAGILPGILLAGLFAVGISIQCRLNPELGPAGPKTTLREKLIASKGVWPVAVLFLLVIGGLYRGFFTPTEAGGIGAAGALIIALFSKVLTWEKLVKAFLDTAQMTSMIFIIFIGVVILGYFISLSDIPLKLSSFIVSLNVSRYVILILILFLYVILGMLMNIVPMIMITLPIIYPTVTALGFDPIWFGVIMVIMMEMGQITPPVGMNVFVISGIARDVPMATVFRGIVPFIFIEIVVLIILILFPDIALYLPNAMDTLAEISG